VESRDVHYGGQVKFLRAASEMHKAVLSRGEGGPVGSCPLDTFFVGFLEDFAAFFCGPSGGKDICVVHESASRRVALI
jgi:hypothetical protein